MGWGGWAAALAARPLAHAGLRRCARREAAEEAAACDVKPRPPGQAEQAAAPAGRWGRLPGCFSASQTPPAHSVAPSRGPRAAPLSATLPAHPVAPSRESPAAPLSEILPAHPIASSRGTRATPLSASRVVEAALSALPCSPSSALAAGQLVREYREPRSESRPGWLLARCQRSRERPRNGERARGEAPAAAQAPESRRGHGRAALV